MMLGRFGGRGVFFWRGSGRSRSTFTPSVVLRPVSVLVALLVAVNRDPTGSLSTGGFSRYTLPCRFSRASRPISRSSSRDRRPERGLRSDLSGRSRSPPTRSSYLFSIRHTFCDSYFGTAGPRIGRNFFFRRANGFAGNFLERL